MKENMVNNSTPLKTCTKCNQSFPATTEFFVQGKRYKDGLNTWCKACYREYNRVNKERIAENKRIYQQENKDTIAKYQRQYHQDNRDKISYQASKRYQANKDIRAKQFHEYRQANREKIAKINREYKRANADKVRINNSRRKARKRQLPDTFTSEQWIACLEYFDYSCAVCEISFVDIPVHADHWIPLSSEDCPGTVASNMVCLCASCNTGKHDKMPDLWLIERYGIDKADEILARIEAYFQSIP